MKVELDINQAEAHGRGRAAHEPARLPARQASAHRRACRLRARRLRRLHRAGRRRGGALLPDVRGAGRRLCHHHHRRPVAGAGRAVAAAGRVLRDPRHAVRLLHAGDDPCRACAAVEESRSRRARRSSTRSPATSAAAPAMPRSSRRSRSRPSACAARTSRRSSHDARRANSASSRPTAACARTAASSSARATSPPISCRMGVKHVALVTCPHPAARIVSIDKAAALAMPGVHYVLDGAELAGATNVLAAGLDTPNVPRRPLARGRCALCRRMGRGGGGRQPRAGRGRRRAGRGRIRAAAVRARRRGGLQPAACWCIAAHGSNVLLDRTFVWGEVEKDFAASPHKLRIAVKWGRSATVPIETFGVTASWDPWREILDVWASIQMPKYPDQTAMALKLPMSSVRVHYDVDVGGSYGVKRGIKHTVLVGYLSRRLGVPVRLIEDRLENMRGGDMHGPERNFDVEVAFDDQGVIRSMKMRALDNVGAYAGRSPFQLGKPVGAIVGPYKIKSVQYQAIAVVTNKTVQEAVRAFGQAPTNYAIERTVDEVANKLGLDRLEVRRRNLIRHEEFPVSDPERLDLRQRRLSGRHRQGAGAGRLRRADRRARPAARARARSPASASPRAWSRPAAIPRSSRCSIPRSAPPPGWTPAASASISSARSPRPCTPRRPGRGTRRWSAPWSARCWRSIPTRCGWCAPTRSIRCRATARSAAAWRSCSAARRSTRRARSRTS